VLIVEGVDEDGGDRLFHLEVFFQQQVELLTPPVCQGTSIETVS